MKRKFALLFALLFLLAITLPGCKSGGEPDASQEPESSEVSSGQPAEIPTINIMIDLWRSKPSSSGLMDLIYSIPGYGTEFTALTETTPYDTQERDAFLTRVKTEIMAGKGPDIFLCENPFLEEAGQGLFPFPQKAVKNHLLLPLDSYIENAEYMDWDRLLPVIMEAGRNDEGQQILPMTFNFSVMAYNRELFTLTEELPVTWDEAITSADPMVRYAADSGSYRDTFGNVVEAGSDEMLVTEEEIVLRMEQVEKIDQETRNGDFPEFTVFNEEFGIYVMNSDPKVVTCIELGSHLLEMMYGNCLGGETEYWLVPKYNTDGGITANIEAFAAINRNTKYPDESFRILDKLLSYNAQMGRFYGALFGMPVNMDVGTDNGRGPNWRMNEWNAGQYQSLLGQINSVRFTTPVEQEFGEIFPDHFNNGGEWPDIVHKHYMKMQMMLAES